MSEKLALTPGMMVSYTNVLGEVRTAQVLNENKLTVRILDGLKTLSISKRRFINDNDKGVV